MERLTNILVECPALIASVRVGVLAPLKPLEDQNKCRVRFLETMKIKSEDIAWCDILISVRGFEYVSWKVAEAAKQAGRQVIYFLDDDLLNIPQDIASSNYFSDEDQKQSLKKIIAISDMLWCVNPLIGEKYSKLGNGKWVIGKVPVELTEDLPDDSDTDTINILYAGSVDHSGLIQHYLSPVVKRLSSEFGDHLSFTFIGADPQLEELNQIKHYGFFNDYDEYRKVLKEKRYHLGLAPLYTSEFYQCKYYNKFIEYTTLGAVGIYTDSLPYRAMVKDNENGFLCTNTFDEWYSVLKKAISDKVLREKCLTDARELLRRDFSPSQVAEKLEMEIPALTSYKAPELKVSNIHLDNMYLLFYAKRAELLWKQNGFKAVPLIVKKALKKGFNLLKK